MAGQNSENVITAYGVVLEEIAQKENEVALYCIIIFIYIAFKITVK